MKIKTVYCYDKGTEWTTRWKNFLPNDFMLVELQSLEEMIFYTSSDSPQFLIVREGALKLGEIPVLAQIVESFPHLRVAAFSHYEELKWSVDVMKVAGVRLSGVPQNRNEFLKCVRECFDPELAVEDQHSEDLRGLLEKCVRENLARHAPLESAAEFFEREFLKALVPKGIIG